jgi:hypothetical protein
MNVNDRSILSGRDRARLLASPTLAHPFHDTRTFQSFDGAMRGRKRDRQFGCHAFCTSNCECELTRMHGGREKAALDTAGWVRPKNAGRILDSGLEIEHDPCWGVVARVFLSTRPSVNTAVHEVDRQIR